MEPAVVAQVLRRARAVTAAFAHPGPPFPVERCAARCGIAEIRRGEVAGEAASALLERPEGGGVLMVARHLPPHTPQWNGALALAMARPLVPPGVSHEVAEELAEIGAAELLLPARAFRPIAIDTDLTMDGLRDLAVRFAAPIRLAVRQWLMTGTWTGLALLWREDAGAVRLGWRAASPGVRFPPRAIIGAPAEDVWAAMTRLRATFRTGRPHHGVEEVRTGPGTAWWFTRFGIVRDEGPGYRGAAGGRAVLALVSLAARSPGPTRAGAAEGIASGSAKRSPGAVTQRRSASVRRSR